jgi:hypothetical protein
MVFLIIVVGWGGLFIFCKWYQGLRPTLSRKQKRQFLEMRGHVEKVVKAKKVILISYLLIHSFIFMVYLTTLSIGKIILFYLINPTVLTYVRSSFCEALHCAFSPYLVPSPRSRYFLYNLVLIHPDSPPPIITYIGTKQNYTKVWCVAAAALP